MRVAACLVVKNEASLITEWIAHYLVCGFDRLLIFDNMSNDETLSKISLCAKSEPIDVFSWPFRGQKALYEFVCTQFGCAFDWIAFFDADEFLTLPTGLSVHDILAHANEVEAVVIPWLIFGSNGLDLPSSNLVMSSYNRRAETSFGPNRHVKSIVRPQGVKNCINPHYFAVSGSSVLPNGEPAIWEREGLLKEFPSVYDVHIRHYFTRSKSDWAARIVRGQFGGVRTWSEFELYDRNEILDPMPTQHLTKVRSFMEKTL